jgi:poly(hydroxyalkanoate) granule-associated protein
MSKLKAKAKASAGTKSGSIMDSAQQIWLAGLGAFSKAQEEGSKLFEGLVKEGLSLEQKTRKIATGKAEEIRGAVETTVGQVRERATDTWDKLEKVFEDRVQRALGRLGVPGRDELQDLIDRVDQLNAAIRNMDGKAKPARKTAAKKAAKKAAAKAPAKKTARKRAR